MCQKSKSEYRNSKQIRNSNRQNPKQRRTGRAIASKSSNRLDDMFVTATATTATALATKDTKVTKNTKDKQSYGNDKSLCQAVPCWLLSAKPALRRAGIRRAVFVAKSSVVVAVVVALASFVTFVSFVAEAVAVERCSIRQCAFPHTEIRNLRRAILDAIALDGRDFGVSVLRIRISGIRYCFGFLISCFGF